MNIRKLEIDIISAAIAFVSKAVAHREVSDEMIDFSELKDTVDRYRSEVSLEAELHSMRFRPASFYQDRTMLFEWRNDILSRSMSFNQAEIDWTSHCAWLTNALLNPRYRFVIAELNGDPIGLIRTEEIDNGSEISWTVAPEYRSRGLGSAMLKLFLDSFPGNYVAKIKTLNFPSIRIVEKTGFQKTSTSQEFHVYSIGPAK